MVLNYIRYYMPSFNELLRSFKLRSKEYLRENTLHGFIYFVDPYRPTWERLIWFICTVASFCTALGFIVTVWQRFQSTPTLTDLDIETESLTITYPGLHLCMTSEYLDVSGMPENVGNVIKTYYDWNWQRFNNTNVTLPTHLSDVFHRVTPNCDALLMDCIDTGVATDCGKLFVKYLTPSGICCKSLPRKFTHDDIPPILSFTLRSAKALNLYIKDIDETPRRNSPITYYLNRNVSIVLQMHITRAHKDLRMLSRTQRACVFDDEAPSHDDCYKTCMKRKVVEVCECVLWFEIAGIPSRECGLNEYTCFVENIRKTDCTDECYLKCEHTDYIAARIENSETTSVSLWWPTLIYIRKTRFGWLDLMVSFGGIMGLFIGYSILTTVELSYYFSLRFYCGAVIDQNQNENIQKIQVRERKKTEEIQMVYYDYIE